MQSTGPSADSSDSGASVSSQGLAEGFGEPPPNLSCSATGRSGLCDRDSRAHAEHLDCEQPEGAVEEPRGTLSTTRAERRVDRSGCLT